MADEIIPISLGRMSSEDAIPYIQQLTRVKWSPLNRENMCQNETLPQIYG